MPRSALNSIGSKDMVNAAAAILGIVGLFAVVGACDSGEPSPEEPQEHARGWRNPLESRSAWYLQSIEGSPIIEGTIITLDLYEGSAGGHDGCNAYGDDRYPAFVPIYTDTEAAYAEGRFSSRGPTMTLLLCEGIEGLMEQTDAYYEALGKGRTFRIQGNRLEILDGVKRAVLVFFRTKPLPGG